ncbi:hypothetical protein IWX90DRAFT_147369 [Phyllosticta citrichinensis]|uniref:Uncharacterized protein n=1 Tax=Phyllosticta citrichinensis TaxID=1130410 RepID=A0ABR1XZ79_9PEZI
MESEPLNFLITGAARGIGRGLSRLLLQRGHRVFLVDNDAEELNHTTTKHLESIPAARNDAFSAHLTNLRQPGDIRAAVARASAFFDGYLDVLINNAAATGFVGSVGFEDLSLEDWNAQVETNLTAPMLLSQLCIPLLRKGGSGSGSSKNRHADDAGGSIIFMSSTRAKQSEPSSEGYASTKAGLLGLTHALACSLAPMGITCNAVLPGWINVSDECKEADEKGTRWEDGLSKEDNEWHWSGRVGKVEDIFRAVEFLSTSRFINGQEIVVDGGVTKKMVYPEE